MGEPYVARTVTQAFRLQMLHKSQDFIFFKLFYDKAIYSIWSEKGNELRECHGIGIKGICRTSFLLFKIVSEELLDTYGERSLTIHMNPPFLQGSDPPTVLRLPTYAGICMLLEDHCVRRRRQATAPRHRVLHLHQ